MNAQSTPLFEDLVPNNIRVYCPHLTDQMLVNYANGLLIAKQKINFQKDHSGFLQRVWGSINGSNARRQQQINTQLADGLDAALSWLTDLTEKAAEPIWLSPRSGSAWRKWLINSLKRGVLWLLWIVLVKQ